jgi:hypothetical protein
MRQYHHAGLVEPARVAAGTNRDANAEKHVADIN